MTLPWPETLKVEKNIYGPPMAKNIYGPPMAKNIYGPQMAKNVYGPPMAKNIYGPKMAKNIYGPPMAKNTYAICVWFRTLILSFRINSDNKNNNISNLKKRELLTLKKL